MAHVISELPACLKVSYVAVNNTVILMLVSIAKRSYERFELGHLQLLLEYTLFRRSVKIA